jgi:hypothetical protein
VEYKEYLTRMNEGAADEHQTRWRKIIKNTKILTEQIKAHDPAYYNLLVVWIKSTEALMNYSRSKNEELQSKEIEKSIDGLYARLGWEKVLV